MKRAGTGAGFALVTIVFTAVGCVDWADDCTYARTCPPPPDAGTAPPPSDACQGTCVPGVSASYDGGPWLVWLGKEQAPGDLCMLLHQAPLETFDGTVPPPALVCPACKCLPSSGSCALPATATASTSTCPGSGQGDVLPAPSAWDGSCTTAGLTIEGGVQSVTVAPLVPMDEQCVAQTETATKLPPPPPQAWSYAHACSGVATGTCPNDGDVCEPVLPSELAQQHLAPGLWTYCISSPTQTTATCPPGYPIERDFGSGYSDARSCVGCACGEPVGSTCSPSLVTLYADDACTTADEVGAVKALTSMSMCVDIPAASPLGSMTATPSMYTGGMCPPEGGEMTGVLVYAPMTFCCQD